MTSWEWTILLFGPCSFKCFRNYFRHERLSLHIRMYAVRLQQRGLAQHPEVDVGHRQMKCSGHFEDVGNNAEEQVFLVNALIAAPTHRWRQADKNPRLGRQ